MEGGPSSTLGGLGRAGEDADGDPDLTAGDGDFGHDEGVGLLEGLGEKPLDPLDVGLLVFDVADMADYTLCFMDRPESGVA